MLFCHCSTNSLVVLSRKYQIQSEKIHWTEWAKTVIVINVGYFWATFKKKKNDSVGLFILFIYLFLRFSQIHMVWWCKCISLGLSQGRLRKIITVIAHSRDAAHVASVPALTTRLRCPANTRLFVVVFYEAVRGKVSSDYTSWSLNQSFWLFFFFFLGSFSPLKQLRATSLSHLGLLWAHGFLTTDVKGISQGYSKNNRLKLMRSLASEQGPERPKICHFEDQEDTGHFSRFLSRARSPKRAF